MNRTKTNTAHERNNSKCEDSYVLPLINDISNSATIEKSIIMLETSRNPWLIARCTNFKGLTPSLVVLRQACAAESAALRSGLGVTVVMMTQRLALDDNTTCQLWSNPNITFYSVDIKRLAVDSPLGKQIISTKLSEL